MFHVAVTECIDKMSSLSLYLSVFPDISTQYYGSGVAQCRGPAVHCALHPSITFQTSNNSQTYTEREEYMMVYWQDHLQYLYCMCVKTTAWVKISHFVQSSLRYVSTIWHRCARSLVEDRYNTHRRVLKIYKATALDDLIVHIYVCCVFYLISYIFILNASCFIQ